MQPIYIEHRAIGDGHRPFIIAELSGNHQQSLSTALAMIEAAAQAGVDAIKLQTYTADSMTLDVDADDFRVNEFDSLWRSEHLYQLYQKASTPYEWHEQLFKRARELGLIAFSSPFDKAAVDFLEQVGVPCFKIASFEITDIPLVTYAASKGKPMIVSTGMATVDEIQAALDCIRSTGNEQIVLLKCTSTYPSTPANSHLATIPDMQHRFGCPVGLSDHSRGIGVAVAAVAVGACVIEKHLVLDRKSGAVDAGFSMEPDEFSQLRVETERAWQAMGQVTYGGSEDEKASKKYRRSIYASGDIKAGDRLDETNLQIIRPAFGLPPSDWELVYGQRAACDIARGTPLAWQLVAQEN